MGRFPGPLVDGLDIVFVREVLARTDFNVTASARELGVPASALRRLFLSDRQLQDEALEAAEARCDLAEQNHMEALRSEDPERRDKASRFELRNSVRARLRGWFNGVLASAEITEPKHFTISWRNADSSLHRSGRQKQFCAMEEKSSSLSMIGALTSRSVSTGPARLRPTPLRRMSLSSSMSPTLRMTFMISDL
jgi:hypothetical protein